MNVHHRHATLNRMAAASGAVLVGLAALLVTVRPASAKALAFTERWCYCEGTYCQDTGGGWLFRWCCDWNGQEYTNCGCTLWIDNCWEEQ